MHDLEALMQDLFLYRKRLIPSECILLKDDMILSRSDETIVTSWKALHARPDLTHGYSCYYLKRGYKVSLFCRGDGSSYWYCDIVDYEESKSGDRLVVTDLLVDVIYEEATGRYRILDLDEFTLPLEESLLSLSLLKKALLRLDALLKELEADGITLLQLPIMQALPASLLRS